MGKVVVVPFIISLGVINENFQSSREDVENDDIDEGNLEGNYG